MADIFVSYTSQDREWAFWIGQQLEKLGHTPRVHEWEISGGGDIAAWMEERHQEADHILCVISKVYLTKSYSNWERRSAQWAAQTGRPNFVLPVRIEDCELPTLLASVKYCDLFGVEETEASERLSEFLKPAIKPSAAVAFPGAKQIAAAAVSLSPRTPVVFPGKPGSRPKSRGAAISNIPINIPRHFLGRDDALTSIDVALRESNGRAAITALHGLRGVGKSTLAAAYAERHSESYRATWWIRAETESTRRTDLVGIGVRLGWVAKDEQEERALAKVMEGLRDEGAGILLIYDNANDPDELRKYLPSSGQAHVIITSTAPDWGDIAGYLKIDVWSEEVGADYLMERTERFRERDAALALSKALGGLPLAHEQAAAYCVRVGITIADYLKRFEVNPGKLPGTQKDAPYDYGRTVATTFGLAIDEAAKLHPAAEPLIVYAALLAPEPIPLFIFSEANEKFDEPFRSALADDGLDEAVATLRVFALVDREMIEDERDPLIATDSIRLHRLVRQVAAGRRQGEALDGARRELIWALDKVYPADVANNPKTWPRARRLDPLALTLVGADIKINKEAKYSASNLLHGLASYRVGPLAAYAEARPLFERALVLDENALGADHSDVGAILNNLGGLLEMLRDLAGARALFERALAISEKWHGPHHPETAIRLNNLAGVIGALGEFETARSLYERALAIDEAALGSGHEATATDLNNLGVLLKNANRLAEAKPFLQRALVINEKALGPDHPNTAYSLKNLSDLLYLQGDVAEARRLCQRALAIRERTLGSDHPDTATSLHSLAGLLRAQGDLDGAQPLYARALAIRAKTLGYADPDTRDSARQTALTLAEVGRAEEAALLREKYGI